MEPAPVGGALLLAQARAAILASLLVSVAVVPSTTSAPAPAPELSGSEQGPQWIAVEVAPGGGYVSATLGIEEPTTPLVTGAFVYDAGGSVISGSLERLSVGATSLHGQLFSDGPDGVDLAWQLGDGGLGHASVTANASQPDARYLVLFHAADDAQASNYEITASPEASVLGIERDTSTFVHTSEDFDAVAGAHAQAIAAGARGHLAAERAQMLDGAFVGGFWSSDAAADRMELSVGDTTIECPCSVTDLGPADRLGPGEATFEATGLGLGSGDGDLAAAGAAVTLPS